MHNMHAYLWLREGRGMHQQEGRQEKVRCQSVNLKVAV